MAANDFQYAQTPSPFDVPVKNTDSTDFAAGNVIKLDTTNVVSGTQPVIGGLQGTAAGVTNFGVAMEAIPQGKTGRVRALGPVVQCIASGSISAGAIVAASTAGKVAAQSAGQAQLGLALTATASDGDACLVMLFGAKNA